MRPSRRELQAEGDDPLTDTAQAEMDDQTARRRARQARELDDLRSVLKTSKEHVGVEPDELRNVVGVALARAGAPLDVAESGQVAETLLYRLDPALKAFSVAGWPEALDSLRIRRRGRAERLRDWRATAPLRAVSFTPAITPEGADAEGVVQVHLEHRLVRRLLSRFLSQGFQAGLSRACVISGSGAEPLIELIGRLALYGSGAARLHEEMLTITATWKESGRGTTPLRPFGIRSQEANLNQVEAALREPRHPPAAAEARIRAWAAKDAADLEPELRRRAAARRDAVAKDLLARGAAEADALRRLLQEQRDRVAKAADAPEDAQLTLFDEQEARQRRLDRQHWRRKVAELDRQIDDEPARVRDGFAVRADRVEIVGLLYLWPGSN